MKSAAEVETEEFRLFTGGRFSLSAPFQSGGEIQPIRLWIGAVILWLPLPISILVADPGAVWRMERWVQALPDHVRILFSFPFVLYAGRVLDSRISRAVRHLPADGDLSRQRISHALERALHARDSLWLNSAFLAIALFLLIGRIAQVVVHGWPGFGVVWSSCIGVTLNQVVVILWVSRTIIWTYLLWVFAGTQLRILPAHPDGRGGLDFLNWVQISFSWTTLGFAILLVADLLGTAGAADRGLIIHSLKVLGVFLLANIAVFLGPLLFFTPQLCRVKLWRMMDYERFADQSVEAYERKWIRAPILESPKGQDVLTADISSVCDLVQADKQSREMSVIIPNLEAIKRFVMACVIPLIPVLLAMIPPEVWMKIVEKIFL